MERIKQADLLEGALLELQEAVSTVRAFATLMSGNSEATKNVNPFDIARMFWLLSRKLNDVTDTIEGVHYEIDKEGL